MAPVLPQSPSSLDLTISMPAYTSSPSGEERGGIIMKGLDMNRLPAGTGGGLGAEEEYWGMAISVEDEEESGGNNNFNNNTTNNCAGPPRKKLRLSKEQSRLLEESFRHNHTLNPKQKEALALQLKLKPRQVEVWFQNRRARSKLKQTEMECEYLKRWFGSLTEQNRRLQREVEELRAMKVGPPTVISPGGRASLPASTLSMCPRCERVTTTTPASTPVASDRDGHARVVKPIATHHRPSPAAC